MLESLRLIDPHGNYRDLKAYQMAEIVHDGTVAFCRRFIDPRSRTTDQMIQSARSGKQNTAEGLMASATSKKSEIKLVGVARASLEELLIDYQDFLRQRGLELWHKSDPRAQTVRQSASDRNRSYTTYRDHIEKRSADIAANTLLCLIHQTNYLLDRFLEHLQNRFLSQGGFSEKLYRERQRAKRHKE